MWDPMNSWSGTRFDQRLTFSQIVPIYYFRCRGDIREIIKVIWILEILFWELWYAKKDNCMNSQTRRHAPPQCGGSPPVKVLRSTWNFNSMYISTRGSSFVTTSKSDDGWIGRNLPPKSRIPKFQTRNSPSSELRLRRTLCCWKALDKGYKAQWIA